VVQREGLEVADDGERSRSPLKDVITPRAGALVFEFR